MTLFGRPKDDLPRGVCKVCEHERLDPDGVCPYEKVAKEQLWMERMAKALKMGKETANV